MSKRRESSNGDEHLRDPEVTDVQKSIELGFDTAKQLTTLSAGSSVLIATFLKDIFSDDAGDLAISAFETLLVGTSFICFGLTLLMSVAAMWLFAVMRRMRAEYTSARLHSSRFTLSCLPWSSLLVSALSHMPSGQIFSPRKHQEGARK
jgi:hypothetical protein